MPEQEKSRPGQEAAYPNNVNPETITGPRSTGRHQYLPEDAPEHHEWPLGFDYASNAEAALYWAALGFPVAPEGSEAHISDPDAVAKLWEAAPEAAVMALPPAGTFGLYSITRKLHALPKGDELLCDGAPQRWDAFTPHWRDDLDGDPVTDTFRVLGTMGGDAAVRLYRAPADSQRDKCPIHFPEGMQLLNGAFPLPCPANPAAFALGMVHAVPPHIARLMDTEPLPCVALDLKGYPCDRCEPFNNARTPAELAAAKAEYTEMEPQGMDVWARAEARGWGDWS